MQRLHAGITLIDSDYVAPLTAAIYLVQDADEVAIVETGTAHSVPMVLDALAQLNLSASAVRYIIPTHVHLDHAGGAPALMAACTEATVLCHPRAERHLVDPSQLLAGAEAVYGKARVQALYGPIGPLAAERVVAMGEGATATLGQRTLTFLDTPGHARHHSCIHDSGSDGVFTGDTFGLAYPDLTVAGAPFLFPTTTPVQFEPDAMCASIERLVALDAKTAYLTHFGPVPLDATQGHALCQQVEAYVTLAGEVAGGALEGEARVGALNLALTQYTLSRIQQLGGTTHPDPAARLAMDMRLNAQGLDVWLARQAR